MKKDKYIQVIIRGGSHCNVTLNFYSLPDRRWEYKSENNKVGKFSLRIVLRNKNAQVRF